MLRVFLAPAFGTILQLLKLPDETVKVLVEGGERVVLDAKFA